MSFRKTDELKVLRDPLHGYIHIEYQILWDLLDTKEMQRLRRIHQLGGVFEVYPGAEHSRFLHSLGVYEICRRVVEEVPGMKEAISEKEMIALYCAALLHDAGHGPFSHFFENISGIKHEKMTIALIGDCSGEIYKTISKYDSDLIDQIISILEYRHPNPILNTVLSSQLDTDRMDYLLRDAYYTGTSYGNFDLERILRTLVVSDSNIYIKRSGIHAVEDYLMARYQMFDQVYLHPDASSYDAMISMFFKRYEKIRKEFPVDVFENLYDDLTTQSFLDMDDYGFYYGFLQASKSKDAVLKDLALRILNRKLFAWIENPTALQEEIIKKRILEAGLYPEYYMVKKTHYPKEDLPYEEKQQPIYVKEGQSVSPLSARSSIAAALLKVEDEPVNRLYFPKEIYKDDLV